MTKVMVHDKIRGWYWSYGAKTKRGEPKLLIEDGRGKKLDLYKFKNTRNDK